MQWTMPHRVLQVVASLLALVALSAFTLGVLNAPSRGRMPGERSGASPGGAAPLAATEPIFKDQDMTTSWRPLGSLRGSRVAALLER